jgi:hypothetical protein
VWRIGADAILMIPSNGPSSSRIRNTAAATDIAATDEDGGAATDPRRCKRTETLDYTKPVVFVAIDSSTANDDEQFIDPTKPVSYNFFTRIPRGVHTVEVLGAAGSNIDPGNPPTVTHLVLTLEYR